MPYDLYVLSETDVTVSGGVTLDGVTQGDGTHLIGNTLTLNAPNWQAVSINDNNDEFSDNHGNQKLDGAQTINGTTYADGTIVEAEYGITVTDGVNTWQMVAFNVRDSSPAYATVEGLAFVGDSGDWPPIGVTLTVIDTQEFPSYPVTDFVTPICFVRGTLIDTPAGPRPVQTLQVGDLVMTQADGAQPVRWCAGRTFAAQGARAPIAFAPGAIGNRRRFCVSQQHRILVSDYRAQLWCGADQVLVPAKAFVNGTTVRQLTGGHVSYHHIMFDTHQIVMAEGVASESFHPGAQGILGLTDAVRDELFDLFPELASDPAAYGPAAHRDVRGDEARVLLCA